MWTDRDITSLEPTERWTALSSDLGHLLDANEPWFTTLANAAAFIYSTVDDINWAGFYLYDGSRLVLGPFGGKPACTTIEIGKGVCGTSGARRETIVVPDVELFPGHIACDAASRSEIVVPLIKNGILLGVLDIDAPTPSRFDEETALGVEALAKVITAKLPDNIL